MTKKILFLLTFLLTTLGGGNFALAATETFTLSTVTSGTSYDQTTQNGVRLIIDGGSTNSVFHNGGNGYRLFHSGASITITAPEGYAVTGLVLTSNSNGNSVSSMEGFTVTGNSDWNPFTVGKATNYTWTNSSNTTNPITFTTKNSSKGDVYIASITVTYSKLPYSGTMPYTWQFHYGGGSNYWPNTTGEMLTANDNSKWSYSEPNYNYQLTPSSEQLVDGNNHVIDETKGLLFTASHAGDIFTGLQFEVGLKNYARVTIPAKAGQKIAVHAYWPKDEEMTLTNATENSFTRSSEGVYTYNFTATADNVTLQVNSSNVYIYYIAVTKNDFAFSEHHTQYWDGTSSTNTKSGTYKAGTTHFNVRANVPAGASVSEDDFTVNSSSDAIDVSSLGYSFANLASGEIWFNNLVVNKSGVAELTFTFKGNDDYNPASFTVLVNVVKGNIPYFQFTYNDKNKDERAISSISLNKTMKYETSEDRVPPFADVTFSSSNTEVATVNSSTGVINFVKPGISVITATFAGNDRYYGAETYFTLVVTGTENTGTITWTTTTNTPPTPPSPGDGQITLKLGDHAIEYPATSSLGGAVKYMSTDKDIVTVNASTGAIEAKHPGVAYIYAYQEGSEGQSWVYKDYKVQVNGGTISIGFEPGSATITKDRILMPRLSIPSLEKADITSLTLTVESGGESYVSVSEDLLLDEFLEMQGYTIAKVHPRITGLAATSEPVKVTAHFVSPYYNNGVELTADFLVTVTNNTDNFSWATPKTEFTIVEGEFMMMPSITGNANGNIDGLSKGSVNAARQGYVYEIKGSNRSITYNTEDYYYGQGVPDYTLTPAAVNGGEAYIYWIKGMDDSHPALMIYGESAGDLTLTATDSQTGYSPGNITIHVVSKDERVKANETTFWNSNKFPFTWDFTNIAPTDITDDEVHWKTKYYGTVSSNAMDLVKNADPGCHLLGMASSFDYNYSDEQDTDNLIAKNKSGDGKDPQAIAKYICNGEGSNCKVMPAFHGIRIALGNNSQGRFHHKRDKVKLFDTSTQYPRLYLEGGLHYLYLPAVGSSKTPGTDYKLFMKVKGHVYQAGDAGNSSHVDVDVLSDDKGNPSTTSIASQYVITENNNYDVKVIGFDIPAEHAGKAIRLGFDKNVDIYWIAYSTEEKLVKRQSNTSYHAATYSYGQDLDIEKSQEANKDVKAYYTTSFSNGKTLAMTPITNSQTTVPSGTGIMLKADKGGSFDDVSSYMVASARNTDNYSTPSSLSGNLLVATPSTGTVDSQETIENKTYTNFLLSYRYMTYDWENGSIVNDSYTNAPDWVFYRIKPGGIASASNMAYLHVEGNMFVDANGNIVNLSRRNSASEETDNQDGPIAPASQNMLKIIFLDEDPIEDSGTTDISTVNERTIDTDAWYTLQGVRVNAPAKGGIYIHKGKKVVVK